VLEGQGVLRVNNDKCYGLVIKYYWSYNLRIVCVLGVGV
jgi:hypothetical protein